KNRLSTLMERSEPSPSCNPVKWCHSSPTGLDPVWFHVSTSIPGSITHPGKSCGYFQR
ncbi:hypothetical protein K443DRAFT_623135, partial [Laccaria amethystina LaAM-08-1]